MNEWAKKDENGKYKYTEFASKDYVDEDGKKGGDHFPFALYLEKHSNGINYEFKENGETLKLTATDVTNPGTAFQIEKMNSYPLGEETNGKAEYVKIRFLIFL